MLIRSDVDDLQLVERVINAYESGEAGKEVKDAENELSNYLVDGWCERYVTRITDGVPEKARILAYQSAGQIALGERKKVLPFLYKLRGKMGTDGRSLTVEEMALRN